MPAIEKWGALSSDGFDMFVRSQRDNPLNFKELTENLLSCPPPVPGELEFFLAMMLATAVIREASRSQ